MGWVNDNGGIKALGGAKLVPLVADAGTSAESAGSAMERLCSDPDVKLAIGCWSSAMTMATTEITERLKIPQFSESLADALNQRGYKYGFYFVTSTSDEMTLGLGAALGLYTTGGKKITTAMLVGDTTVASAAYYDSCRKALPAAGIKIVDESLWTQGTLTDATPIMQKVKTVNPDLVMFMGNALSEAQICLMKKRELGITTPFLANGGWFVDPSFLKIGAEALEGAACISPLYPSKLTPEDWIKRSLEQCRKEYSDEPWMGQELGFNWSSVPVIAEILERTGSTDSEAILKTAYSLDLHDVMATRHTAKQGIAFDANGRIAKKYQGIFLVQWQSGRPQVVYPTELATAKPLGQ